MFPYVLLVYLISIRFRSQLAAERTRQTRLDRRSRGVAARAPRSNACQASGFRSSSSYFRISSTTARVRLPPSQKGSLDFRPQRARHAGPGERSSLPPVACKLIIASQRFEFEFEFEFEKKNKLMTLVYSFHRCEYLFIQNGTLFDEPLQVGRGR